MTHVVEKLDLQVVGLMFDLAGILVLGLPPLVRVVDEIAGQSGTHWDYNPNAIRILSAARVDLAAGSVLLALGFVMQAAAIWGFSVSSVAVLMMFLGLPTLGLLYFCWLRSFVSAAVVARVMVRFDQQQRERRAKDA